MTDPLAGIRAIVTGGASGMGAGIVSAYAAHGAQVISLDIQAGPGTEIAEKATAAGPGQARFVAADVSDKASVDAAFARACEALGGLDVLVHAAGIAPGAPAQDIAVEDWDNVFAINARGACCYRLSKHERSLVRWSGGVNLKERAASQGISYATARRWHDTGTLPAAAYQVGRLIVTGDPAPAARAGVAAVYARRSSAGRKDDPGRQVARVTGWAAAEGLPAGRVMPAARRDAGPLPPAQPGGSVLQLSDSALGDQLRIK